ncbi:MAG: M20/M25/M40 family metallo-hydrolase [Gemmatimonadota bacterium]|nr:M20/M25/M40 family metallo-hydrolase [Gemmatimonadota bacterium]
MDNEQPPTVETARAGDPVALARLLVSIPSVNPVLSSTGQGERRMAEVTADLLEGWGFRVRLDEVAPGRPNVVGTLDGAGPRLLLNGHLDTVGVDGMTIDPFGATMDGDRLMGRGSCDMKGGVAALLAAARRLSLGQIRPNLVVALTADEEHSSIGMAALTKEHGGSLADFAVVCEPTNLRVMPAHKGFVWLRAVFHGRAAHGSRPDVGVDAIRHAGLFLAALDGYADELRTRPRHELLDFGSFHAGTISGGTAESVYPDRCELLLERRTMPGEGTAAVVAEFERVLDEVRGREPRLDATLETTLDRPGTEVARTSPLVEGLLRASSESGVSSGVEGMTAWVDAAFLNEAGIPAVCFGPGSIEQAHTEDEWIDVGQIHLCADVLERFARSLVP